MRMVLFAGGAVALRCFKRMVGSMRRLVGLMNRATPVPSMVGLHGLPVSIRMHHLMIRVVVRRDMPYLWCIVAREFSYMPLCF
jgi:hypothetical protein